MAEFVGIVLLALAALVVVGWMMYAWGYDDGVSAEWWKQREKFDEEHNIDK